MKLAIVGSRDFTNYEFLKEKLEPFVEHIQVSEIVSGGARGVDKLAERFAEEKAIPCRVFTAFWDWHGKSAGFIRNKQIVESSDHIIAFWDGKSKGTKHSIDLCKQLNKTVSIVMIN